MQQQLAGIKILFLLCEAALISLKNPIAMSLN